MNANLSPRALRAALLAACCVLGTACEPSVADAPPLASQEQPLPGQDGDFTITEGGTIVNQYAVLAADAAAGATSIQVTAATDLDHAIFGPLSPGDLLLIIQMQGASIDTSDTSSYGTITNLNGAGLYEFAVVRKVVGNTIQLSCSGLKNSYSKAGRTQVVRVPEFTNLTILSGGSLVARPWDGQRGGVVAVHVVGTTQVDGPIDVSGQGFRAGAVDNLSAVAGTIVTVYASSDASLGGEKGEGIAGDSTVYSSQGGKYGRGAPANGGGGGNSYNAGGGGGANGNNGNVWGGHGVMSNTVTGAAAWTLDPAYAANGNTRTNESGGGRGGYSFSSANADALTTGPNNPAWAGNNRSEVGGLGGRPLNNDPASRLFLGGGGGAGDANNNAGGGGGNGGGLVFLISGTVTGSDKILANGTNGMDTVTPFNDSAGGGGGGGTVVVLSASLSGISVAANGGSGGRQLITTAEAEGPGGGGGGGYVALKGGTVTTSVNGGQSGTTSSSSLTEFPVNGATFGAAGQSVAAPDLPRPFEECVPNQADLSIAITDSPDPVSTQGTITYNVQVNNGGTDFAEVVTVTFPIPAGSAYSSVNAPGWTCARAGNQVTCDLPNLPVGVAPPITIVVTPTIDSGVINATVYVNAATPDPTAENNEASTDTTLTAVNDPPVNTVPGPQTTPEDTPLVFSTAGGNAISVADPDAGGDTVQVTFTVTHGTLTLSGTTGLTFSAGDGTSDTTMTFTGTLAAINAGLAGLSFTPDANYNGDATLTITSDDLGHNGPGGPKTDTDTVAITVTPVSDPPKAVDDTATVDQNSRNDSIDVLANDFADNTETLTVTAVTQGNQGGTVTIIDGGTGVTYTPAPGFTGTETFTYTISDGQGGTSTATVTVTVEPIVRRVVGGGCSASGDSGMPSAFWMLLAVVSLTLVSRRSARASGSRGTGALLGLGVLSVLAASPSARAQEGSSTAIDVQQFKPAPGKYDVLGLHGAGVPGHLNWRAGLYLNYAQDPLVVINAKNSDLLQHLVQNQLGFDLAGAIGLGEHFELGATVPLALQHGEFNEQSTGGGQETWKGGLGDLRLVPKALIFEKETFRLAFALPVVLPTGGGTNLQGQKGLGAQPRVAADYAFENGTRVLANVGVNLRSRQELLNLSVGNELSYGVGASIPFQLQGHQLTGLASLAGALGLGATGGANEEEVPLEVQAGLQYHFSKHVMASVGLGRGVTLGYGTPAFRIFSGFSYTPDDRPKVFDTDGDGIIDPEDKCPTDPEDKDQFEDLDGCPEPDNDHDGILDTADKCPNVPEDKDGFQDEDGCPDRDNDQDGILDPADKCPLEPEDKDGYQDEDGCPDPDNDQDGILDVKDKCPMQPEDKDGFQDEDGCPDPDNDKDGVLDPADQCPLEPETINGIDDQDGCPDKGKPTVELTSNSIVILQKVYFATNKDVVLARSFPLLQQVGQVLRGHPEILKVRIEGHTDDRADDAFNMDLSQRRAGNVRKYLVEQVGIAPDRLEAVGYGESQPVDTNATEKGRENNRRVVFTILKMEGMEDAAPAPAPATPEKKK